MQSVHDELFEKITASNSIIKQLLNESNTVVCSTKFGADSLVFLHLVTSIAPAIPILWVDTGYNSRSTLAFVDEAVVKLNLNLQRFKPKQPVLEIPPTLDDPAHAAFKESVKLNPFRDALNSLGATHWLSSIRAYQTPNRQKLPCIVKMSGQLTKVHPILNWSKADVDLYRRHHQLPVGPEAYDPTKGGALRECGLHEVTTFF